VLFIREIDPDKSERILAILFDKEVSRIHKVGLYSMRFLIDRVRVLLMNEQEYEGY
jgi:hypothetical protein